MGLINIFNNIRNNLLEMIKSNIFISVFILSVYFNSIVCPPTNKIVPPANADASTDSPSPDDPILNLEYHRYLKEVVGLLESDSAFKDLIEKASPEDIKSGKIAEQLQFVQHNVRSKLDELKRKEVDRMRDLISKRAKMMNVGPEDINKMLPKHLDHSNVKSFESKDLEKLIKTASNDLEEYDKLRRMEFKEHEMQKELERRQKLDGMDLDHKKKSIEDHEKNIAARRHHDKVNEPGHKEQLEEVWDDEDGLDGQKFNAETFFNLHDIDGNNYLDESEIEALFNIELNKLYNTTDPEYDPQEREEEMNRMREHVFGEMDKNKDKMISKEEFIKTTNDEHFDVNDEWKDVEDEDLNEREFEEYRKSHDQPEEGHQQQNQNQQHHEQQQNQNQQHHEQQQNQNQQHHEQQQNQNQQHHQQQQNQNQQHHQNQQNQNQQQQQHQQPQHHK